MRLLDSDRDASTLAGNVYTDLRQKIIAGVLAPGVRLSPAALAAGYAVSSTVVREALTRLTAERLARSSPQQGYSVSDASKEELIDLAKVRMLIDAEALRLSIQHNDLAWKGALVSAHYMLTHVSSDDAAADEATINRYGDVHYAFHAALVSGCGSQRLVSLSKQLYDESELYRHRLRNIYPQSVKRSNKEHNDIVEATLAGDEKRATALLIEHFQSSINELVSSGLLDRGPGPGRKAKDFAVVPAAEQTKLRRVQKAQGEAVKPTLARRRVRSEKAS